MAVLFFDSALFVQSNKAGQDVRVVQANGPAVIVGHSRVEIVVQGPQHGAESLFACLVLGSSKGFAGLNFSRAFYMAVSVKNGCAASRPWRVLQ